jgi:hypothetical protein
VVLYNTSSGSGIRNGTRLMLRLMLMLMVLLIAESSPSFYYFGVYSAFAGNASIQNLVVNTLGSMLYPHNTKLGSEYSW